MTSINAWNRRLSAYAAPVAWRSFTQLGVTLFLFAIAIVGAHALYQLSWALALPSSIAAGLLLVRLFIVQHDCGHYSFLRSRAACDWIGRGLSILTFTPYYFWRRDHDKHHATSGDLDRRGVGDIDTLTVKEYRAMDFWGRFRYRLYRHPAVLFGIGPAWQFIIRNRLPLWLSGKTARKAARSILLTNVTMVVFFGGLGWLLGYGEVAAVWLPAILVGASVGVWLFYVQHNFEHTYWARHEEWTYVDAALRGCSYYKLPGWLHWLTGYIGFHHIHHLSAKIPNYNLPRAFAEVSELQDVRSIGLLESLGAVRLALWCEERRHMVSFREAAAA
ncbi:fatty acid desaturase [Telmatospirillum sp. J64-1]|uniref:fatty acid desaturase n=1 Tax=Telmatospirillum sp. J64-1 TaxID=2502183 RepID=UPI00115D1645|nr:fatty acid desaturase [Telmatospirillum sp. J64-1]